MGACTSCLPGNRQRHDYEEDDEAQLLDDDMNDMHYGSFGQQQLTGQDDPLETQREVEALQRVVARTSDNMVDIFEITPQDSHAIPTQYEFEGQDPKLARYQNLLSKLTEEPGQQPPSLSSTASTKVDWVPWDEDTIEMHHGATVPLKVETSGPLVGTFADATAAATSG